MKVPVLLDYDRQQTVGILEIDETALPPLPDWHLGLGFRLLSAEGKYELKCVSIVSDSKFKAWETYEHPRTA